MEIQKNRKQQREKLQIIAQSSKNWDEKSIFNALQKYVYPSQNEALTFSEYFFMGIGALLFMAGILFFFAYNWQDLSNFQKLGILQIGLLAIGIGSLFIKKRLFSLQISLTILSVLTGVLFAVFGQIYQTGANYYDLFLMWCFAITIWVAISNFPPLWYFFFVLIQTTTILYKFQVAQYNANFSSEFILFGFGIVFLISWEVLSRFSENLKNHSWFPKLLFIQSTVFLSSLICRGIFWDKLQNEDIFWIALITYFIFITISFFYSYKKENLFNISILAISTSVVFYCGIIRWIDAKNKDAGAFFFLSFLIIITAIGIFYGLVQLHKKWNRYA